MAASILFNPRWQLISGDGTPYANATLQCYAANSVTPQPVYSDVDLTVPLDNPVEADADGRFPQMFMLPTGYDLIAYDEDANEVWSAENYSDPGTVFAQNFGTSLTTGSALNVSAGYLVTETNTLVTVASSGATVINLPPVADKASPVLIQNRAGGTVVITPNGSETIQFTLSTLTLSAASSPSFPSAWLFPFPASATWVQFA